MSDFNPSLNPQNLEDYLISTQYFYHIWQKNKSLNEEE